MTGLSRRLFLGGILAASAAVAIPFVKAMPVRPILYGDGIHDDADALNALLSGAPVDLFDDSLRLMSRDWIVLQGGVFRCTKPLVIKAKAMMFGSHFINEHDGNHLSVEDGGFGYTHSCSFMRRERLYLTAGDFDVGSLMGRASGGDAMNYRSRIRL